MGDASDIEVVRARNRAAVTGWLVRQAVGEGADEEAAARAAYDFDTAMHALVTAAREASESASELAARLEAMARGAGRSVDG